MAGNLTLLKQGFFCLSKILCLCSCMKLGPEITQRPYKSNCLCCPCFGLGAPSKVSKRLYKIFPRFSWDHTIVTYSYLSSYNNFHLMSFSMLTSTWCNFFTILWCWHVQFRFFNCESCFNKPFLNWIETYNLTTKSNEFWVKQRKMDTSRTWTLTSRLTCKVTLDLCNDVSTYFSRRVRSPPFGNGFFLHAVELHLGTVAGR